MFDISTSLFNSVTSGKRGNDLKGPMCKVAVIVGVMSILKLVSTGAELILAVNVIGSLIRNREQMVQVV